MLFVKDARHSEKITALQTLVEKSLGSVLKKLNENAKVPERGTDYSAGYDLYALCAMTEDLPPASLRYHNFASTRPIDIPPHKTVRVRTGLALEIPEGYFGAIFARSGLSTKNGLRPSNCLGVIDCDYRGEVLIPLHNDSEYVQTVFQGDRIAQLIVLPYQDLYFDVVEELEDSKRGEKGFGSTGGITEKTDAE